LCCELFAGNACLRLSADSSLNSQAENPSSSLVLEVKHAARFSVFGNPSIGGANIDIAALLQACENSQGSFVRLPTPIMYYFIF
jgi:hypothetical protein